MGTWDAGNFDDDSALDWLATEIQEPLVAKIQQELANHDEENGTVIMAAVEVLTILCEHVHAAPPKPEEVGAWRDTYIRDWNSYIDDLDPQPGFKEARHQTIRATFQRLEDASKAFWKK